MKTWLLSIGVLVFTALVFMSCNDSINNSITFQNMADGDIYVNFRGRVITVASGQTTVINNIPKGSYTYSTTYTVPAGVSGSSATGALSGTLVLGPGTKIQILYASIIINGTYTINATISDSDNQSKGSKITYPGQNSLKFNTTLTGP